MINKAYSQLNREQLIEALSVKDFEPYRKRAEDITLQNFGKKVYVRAILEYTNYCNRRCKYCGLNCMNNDIARYRLTDDEIIATAFKAHKSGYQTIVLQGGEDPHFDGARLAKLVKEIVKCGIIVTVSAGELSDKEYQLIRASGAKRYLLKHETADERIYQYLHDDYPLSRRVECLRTIKRLGYDTGSGFMIGLPNQTVETIADDILLLQELQCDMAGIGPFIPSEGTELSHLSAGSGELTRRAVALVRIKMPNILLPATTSLQVLEGESAKGVFEYGANVIMRKVTPTFARALYKIYPSQSMLTDIDRERQEIEDYVKSFDRIPI